MERIAQAKRYKVATEHYGTELMERFFKDQNNGQDLSEDLPGETKIRKETQTHKQPQTLVSVMFAYLSLCCCIESYGLRRYLRLP